MFRCCLKYYLLIWYGPLYADLFLLACSNVAPRFALLVLVLLYLALGS